MSKVMNLSSLCFKGNCIQALKHGLSSPLSSRSRLASTAVSSIVSFGILILSTNIGMSLQMISSGKVLSALYIRLTGLSLTAGYSAVLLNILFSILVGITFTNTLTQLRRGKVSKDALGSIPGFVAGGCASCGVGVLSLLGLGGVLASLPFQGDLLRLAGVLMLGALILRTGDPELCEI
ncbi:MAG: hypothetical protein J07AB43_09520 [Candidatus Nanosalina sp. J07AB43]|nr:MAG: hypothetical protein J07AB43_09520 [Candidatus Nanosalina sp. J07AB43]